MLIGIQGDTRGAVEAMSAALPEVKEGVELAASQHLSPCANH
jgi:methyl-accepting chemotaxis protein